MISSNVAINLLPDPLGDNAKSSSPLGEGVWSAAPGGAGSVPRKSRKAHGRGSRTSRKAFGVKAQRALRAEKYRAQSLARDILLDHARGLYDPEDKGYRDDVSNFHRTTKCLRVRYSESLVGIHQSNDHGKAFYSGLVVCGSVWSCPVCAAKIQNRRAVEISRMFGWAYSSKDKPKYQVMMLTLTYPHALSDDLEEMLKKHAYALKLFRAGKAWVGFKDRVGYKGLIRSLEITHGANGWHPHTHELYVINHDIDEAGEQRVSQFLRDRWEKCCIKAGLLNPDDEKKVVAFRQHSTNIKFHVKDSDYLAKMNNIDRAWGADKEMAKASTKIGKMDGKSPFDLLAQSENKVWYKKLFLEYSLKMKGKMQLFWSKGLKQQVGITEKSDEEIATEEEDSAVVLARLNSTHWRVVIDNNARAKILDIAEASGTVGLRKWFIKHGVSLDKYYWGSDG